VQCRRDREGRQRAVEHIAIRLFPQQTALQHALGQFLDEQWHAVGALGDLGDNVIGQCLAAGDLCDQRGAVALVEAIERQHADLGLAGPWRLKLGPEGHDQQHRQAADMLDHEVEQLARGRVDPMRILEDHNHGLSACQTFEMPDQRLQCPFPLALRAEVRQRVVRRRRQ